MPDARPDRLDAARRVLNIDDLETHYFDVGVGIPLVLLHGGEFGGCAELCWEHNIFELAAHFRVVAPDLLGFGGTAKVYDFIDGKARRLRHLARFCEQLGIQDGVFVGNSMGGAMLLNDAGSTCPQLRARKIVSVCGGGPLENNDSVAALFDYDGSIDAMRQILDALFDGQYWRTDEEYLRRRHEASIAPGAWEAVAAARFRRPTTGQEPKASQRPAYDTITVPVLIVEGGCDKLKPRGWAKELEKDIPGATSAVIGNAGHCPQIEQPAEFRRLLLDFAAN
jgi:pimeloyl-ACP methyl ester carboxylesterase